MSCWELVGASDEGVGRQSARGEPQELVTLCEFKGRQVWRYNADREGGEYERRAEEARRAFSADRKQNHSSDVILRLQREAELGDAPAALRRGPGAGDAGAGKRGKKRPGAGPRSSAEDEPAQQRRGIFRRGSSKARRDARETYPERSDEGASKRQCAENGAPREDDPEVYLQSLRDGLSFFERLQCEDGHFPGDYGGPLFLLPGLLIVLYVTDKLEDVLSVHHRREMIRYLENHQRDDGGYGLHIEGERSTMFGTALSYVSMRILGLDADHPACARARAWILEGGGATQIPSWGKFWLCVLGVYEWEGLNPMPPEMWLLPYKFNPLHPGRFWCHCRMVYLPMSYVYGRRGTCRPTRLTEDLRKELYAGGEGAYAAVDWDKSRNECHSNDLYYPHPLIQDMVWFVLHRAEPMLLPGGSLHWLRQRALKEAISHVHYEDVNTRYVDIGPVNKVVNMLCCWLEAQEQSKAGGADASKWHDAFKMHLPRIMDYLWVAEDGMKMQGYNGSQLWDTAFAAQALEASGLGNEFRSMALKMHGYIEATQVREDCPGPLSKYYRHISKGAWPFSTRDHGWPITDCSSEGLKAAMFLNDLLAPAAGPKGSPERISDDRLYDCVNVILSFQNGNGGWATYENTRSYQAVEILNPAETFGDIMIDYSYVECSTACITALCRFRKVYPAHRAGEISAALSRGRKFIEGEQREDGSWYGSWGVCFTYAIWFGCESLHALGETYESCESLRKACGFLLSKQRDDGGWGESYLSCQDKVYSQLPVGEASHVVNTAWAMLALMYAGQYSVDSAPLRRAARFLVAMQHEDGDWPQQHISGVFNRNCMITYANYRNIFPIWALGEYRKRVVEG